MDPGSKFLHLIRISSTTASSHPLIIRRVHVDLSKIFRHYTMYNVMLLLEIYFPFLFASGTNKLIIISKKLLLCILFNVLHRLFTPKYKFCYHLFISKCSVQSLLQYGGRRIGNIYRQSLWKFDCS